MDTFLTVAGNLTADPTARTTASGATVVHLRIASSGRKFDRAAGEFRESDPLFISVSCWRAVAHNVLGSGLRKGDSVIVYGRLNYRSYEDKDGTRRNVHEIDAIAVGPDLSRCPVELRRVSKAGGAEIPEGASATEPEQVAAPQVAA